MWPAAAPGRVEADRLGGAGRQRGGVLGDARELDADRVARLLADDARAHEDVGDRARQALVERGGDQAGALGHHLARVRGPAHARDPAVAERGRQQHRRRRPVRRHEPLGERDHRRAAAQPGGLEALDDLLQPARGDAEEDVVGPRRGPRRPARSAGRAAAARRAGRPCSRGRPPGAGTARACGSGAWCGSRRGPAGPRRRSRTSPRRPRRRAGSRGWGAPDGGEAALPPRTRRPVRALLRERLIR